MNARTIVILFAVLVLTVLGLQLNKRVTDSPTNTAPDMTSTAPPDLQIESPVMVHFDEQGRAAWRVTGSSMQYREHDGHSTIEQPVAFIRPKADAEQTNQPPASLDAADPWQLTSRVAVITDNQQRITLDGDARVRNSEIDVQSERLEFDTQRQFATTDKAVTILSHGATTHAEGLQADLLNKNLRLPSRVKEIHEPPKKK